MGEEVEMDQSVVDLLKHMGFIVLLLLLLLLLLPLLLWDENVLNWAINNIYKYK